MLPKRALFEYLFSTPTLTRKIEDNNQNRKPMCRTKMSLVLKFIWFNSLALALLEPSSGNRNPNKFQRALTRDRKLISIFFNKWSFKKLQIPCRNEKDIDVSKSFKKKKRITTRLYLSLFKNKNDGGLFDLYNREFLFLSPCCFQYTS